MGKTNAKTDGLAAASKVGISLMDIGWRLAITVVAFLLLGKWLDNRYQTKPLFAFVGLVLIVASFVLIVRRALRQIPKSQGGLKND